MRNCFLVRFWFSKIQDFNFFCVLIFFQFLWTCLSKYTWKNVIDTIKHFKQQTSSTSSTLCSVLYLVHPKIKLHQKCSKNQVTPEIFHYSPILGRSSIWDLKYTFSRRAGGGGGGRKVKNKKQNKTKKNNQKQKNNQTNKQTKNTKQNKTKTKKKHLGQVFQFVTSFETELFFFSLPLIKFQNCWPQRFSLVNCKRSFHLSAIFSCWCYDISYHQHWQ